VSWPTLLLVVQLGVGLYAAFELLRSLARRRLGPHVLGQMLMALLLLPLALDGLVFQADLIGWLGYTLDLDPAWLRPGQLGLIAVGTLLWMTERESTIP
jgi:hypothetical protein